MRKFNGKSNITGSFIEQKLTEKNITKEDFCRKLQLYGLNIDRFHLYDMLEGKVIIKDFELLIICNILKLNYDELKSLVNK